MISRTIARVTPKNTMLLLCDMQEAFRDRIYCMPSCIQVSQMMNHLGTTFNLPTVVTEHNSKVFGKVIKEIAETLPKQSQLFEKTCFSMMGNDFVKEYLGKQNEIKSVILYGIEAHACVHQTTLDLLEKGYDVFLLADGISSHRELDRKVALKKLEKAGAILTTAECVIFEMLRDSKHPEFKKLLPVLKWDRSIQIKDLYQSIKKKGIKYLR